LTAVAKPVAAYDSDSDDEGTSSNFFSLGDESPAAAGPVAGPSMEPSSSHLPEPSNIPPPICGPSRPDAQEDEEYAPYAQVCSYLSLEVFENENYILISVQPG
jgi:hypothetical protein